VAAQPLVEAERNRPLVENVNNLDWKNRSAELAEKSRLAARDPSASVGMTAKGPLTSSL
jgi:hypothetical protein